MTASGNSIEYRISLYLSILVSLLIVAAVIISVDFPDHSLELARQEGVVSRTILDNYSDHQESLQYGFAVLISPCLALVFFSLINRMAPGVKGEGRAAHKKKCPKQVHREEAHDRIKSLFSGFFRYVLPPLLIVFIAYDPNFVSRWINIENLMLDEGYNLAAINEILSGKVLYKDLCYIYGPLTTYPAAFLMKVFGTHIFVWRYYILGSSIAGLLVLFFSLFRFNLSSVGRWTAAILMTILYYPVFTSFTWVSLRVALGILAIAFYVESVNTQRFIPLFFSGFISSTALFYSQETGIAAIMTIGACILLSGFVGFSPRTILFKASSYLLGILPPAVMVLVFFYLHYGLSEFIDGFFSGPQYFILGWGALPFPDFVRDLSLLLKGVSWEGWVQFVRGDVAFYFPVVLYLGLLCYYSIKIMHKEFSLGDFSCFACLLFGIILFNSTLARSDEAHLIFVSAPAVILSLKIIGHLFQSRRDGRPPHPLTVTIPLGALIVFGLFSLLTTDEARTKILAIKNRVTGRSPYVMEIPDIRFEQHGFKTLLTERAKGLFIPLNYKVGVDLTVSFIEEHTRPDEPIFAFPNKAVFYFLTGRPSATAYVSSEDMATRKQRQEAVAQLIRSRPHYVIIDEHLDTHIDKILIQEQNPEVFKYIQENYQVIRSFPGVKIAERISGS